MERVPDLQPELDSAVSTHGKPGYGAGVTSFHSTSLKRDMHYRVLLPSAYDDSGRFPSLYLLHGIYRDYKNSDTRTDLEHYARALNLLIVMPNADGILRFSRALLRCSGTEPGTGGDCRRRYCW